MTLPVFRYTYTYTRWPKCLFLHVLWRDPYIDDLGFTSLVGGERKELCENITRKGMRRDNGLIERKRRKREQGGGINVEESKSLVTGDSLVDCYVCIHILFTP